MILLWNSDSSLLTPVTHTLLISPYFSLTIRGENNHLLSSRRRSRWVVAPGRNRLCPRPGHHCLQAKKLAGLRPPPSPPPPSPPLRPSLLHLGAGSWSTTTAGGDQERPWPQEAYRHNGAGVKENNVLVSRDLFHKNISRQPHPFVFPPCLYYKCGYSSQSRCSGAEAGAEDGDRFWREHAALGE